MSKRTPKPASSMTRRDLRSALATAEEELAKGEYTKGECGHTIGSSVDEDGCCVSCGEDLNYLAVIQTQLATGKSTKECRKNCEVYKAWLADSDVREKLATSEKQAKNIKDGAENNIYNLLNSLTNNKYGPYSVSQKDAIMPQWFDALVKETKVLITQLATSEKTVNELIAGIDTVNNEGVRLRRENERLRKAMDYDKRKLSSKIVEALVMSQFSFWVEPANETDMAMTANDIKNREKRAFDYYLQRDTDQKDIKLLTGQNRFHSLIDNQNYFLMLLFEQALKGN